MAAMAQLRRPPPVGVVVPPAHRPAREPARRGRSRVTLEGRSPMRSCTTISSPIGDLTLVADEAALCAVLWNDQEPADDVERVDRDDHAVLRAAAQQLDEYFAGERTDFDVP